MTPETFKYYVGPGNNEELVRKVLSHRQQWEERTDVKSSVLNFKWQQTPRGFRYE